MKFVKTLIKNSNLELVDFAREVGVSRQLVDYWTGYAKKAPTPRGMNLDSLCKLRKVSKISWEVLGKMLDSEFLK